MDFLTSEWFTWVCIVIVTFSIISIFYESFTEGHDVDWNVLWHYTKKVIGFILTMVFLPAVIVYGIIHESKAEKKRDSSK
jgi:hypothetical protein